LPDSQSWISSADIGASDVARGYSYGRVAMYLLIFCGDSVQQLPSLRWRPVASAERYEGT
jgi:hypothetical protein